MNISIINERFACEILTYKLRLEIEFEMLEKLQCVKEVAGQKIIYLEGKKIGKL